MNYKINYSIGGKPLPNILKNINLFRENTMAHYLLDPINGFFFFESGALINYYNFGQDDYPISKISREKRLFIYDNYTIRPSNIYTKDLTSHKIGEFLGQCFYNRYIKHKILDYYKNEIDNIKNIKKNIKLLKLQIQKKKISYLKYYKNLIIRISILA